MAHLDHEKEAKDAYRWFFLALIGSIAFVLFLVSADYRLTNSDSEKVLSRTLRELRMAQTTLSSGAIDARMHESPRAAENGRDESHEAEHH